MLEGNQTVLISDQETRLFLIGNYLRRRGVTYEVVRAPEGRKVDLSTFRHAIVDAPLAAHVDWSSLNSVTTRVTVLHTTDQERNELTWVLFQTAQPLIATLEIWRDLGGWGFIRKDLERGDDIRTSRTVSADTKIEGLDDASESTAGRDPLLRNSAGVSRTSALCPPLTGRMWQRSITQGYGPWGWLPQALRKQKQET